MDNRKQIIVLLIALCILLVGCGSTAVQTEQALTEAAINTETNTETTPETPPVSSTESAVGDTSVSQTSYNQELLTHITIKDGFAVADYAESSGDDYSYAIYRFLQTNCPVNNAKMYWEVFVMDGETIVTILRIEDEEHGSAFSTDPEMVLEYDVNFDGINDILLCLGHFGNQGAIAYKCYLAEDNTFTHCPSFTNIVNPSIDSDAHIVRSQWRNWAASHSWAIYICQDNVFTMTECLTESLKIEEDGTETWFWQDEILKDGEMQIREEYTEHDYDPETLYQKRYGPDSYWGLDQEKWNTL